MAPVDPSNQFPARLRRLRLTNGLTAATAAASAKVSATTWRSWETGVKRPTILRAPDIASALGVAVKQLFTDDAAFEVVVSAETRDRIRREGDPALEDVTARLSSALSSYIGASVVQRAVDVSHGARPKRRRSRAEVLRGSREATRMIAERDARRASELR